MNLVPLLVLAACVTHAPTEPTKAVRGLAAQIDVEYAPKLRARADQTPNSPVLVRVTPGPAANRQHIEFIGALAGDFDLRDHLEREDGQPLGDLATIPISVVSRLPADHGVDLYGTSGSWMNWRAHYRELMWGAVAIWVAIPIFVMVVRAIRRPRAEAPAPPPVPPPSVAEQLATALDAARGRTLTVAEAGQLELLLLRYLGGDSAVDTADLASTLSAVRENESTGPLVVAIERWLHAKGSGDSAREHAAAVLEEFRRTRLALRQPVEVPA